MRKEAPILCFHAARYNGGLKWETQGIPLFPHWRRENARRGFSPPLSSWRRESSDKNPKRNLRTRYRA